VPTNFYFNNFPANQVTSEQLLIEDLVIESMQINGMDVFYMPRSSRDSVDYLYGEDPTTKFTQAYPIEMYLENVTGMDGEQDFISKFGLEIRDEMRMLISRRRFKATVPQLRPNEGDIIYVPLVENFFEITFVEHENDQAMFYTLGRGRGGNVYVYAIKMKQYVFSNEVIETGVAQIDNQIRDSYARVRLALDDTNDIRFLQDEIVYQGTNLANSTAQALVYEFNPNSDIIVYRTQGRFASGGVRGVTSGAQGTILVADDTVEMNNAFEDIIDNRRIQEEGVNIIDWTEKNPFGET
jgi:hypothetical protein